MRLTASLKEMLSTGLLMQEVGGDAGSHRAGNSGQHSAVVPIDRGKRSTDLCKVRVQACRQCTMSKHLDVDSCARNPWKPGYLTTRASQTLVRQELHECCIGPPGSWKARPKRSAISWARMEVLCRASLSYTLIRLLQEVSYFSGSDITNSLTACRSCYCTQYSTS